MKKYKKATRANALYVDLYKIYEQVGEKYGLTAEQVQVVYECYFKTFSK